MNRFLALLGQPSLSVFFSLPARNEHCFKDHNDFYFSVLLPLFFLGLSCCTAKEARPWQYQYKSTVNMLEVLVTPVHVSQTHRNQVSTQVSPFTIYRHQYHTLLLPYHPFYLLVYLNYYII